MRSSAATAERQPRPWRRRPPRIWLGAISITSSGWESGECSSSSSGISGSWKPSSMLIGDYFDEISRLIHEHETAGLLLSCELLTDARSEDLGYLRATLTFSDRSELHVREYVRLGDDRVER